MVWDSDDFWRLYPFVAGCFCSLMIESSGQLWLYFHLHCWMHWIDILGMFWTYLDVGISEWKGKDQLFIVIVVDTYWWACVLVYSAFSSVLIGLWEAASDDEMRNGKIFTWSLSSKMEYVKGLEKVVNFFMILFLVGSSPPQNMNICVWT